MIFINQLREKIGTMGYGPTETTTGGRALKFYASVRIDIRRTEYVKNGSENVGNHIRAKIVKNKIAPPFKTAEFDIMYGLGINYFGELVDLGISIGEVENQALGLLWQMGSVWGRAGIRPFNICAKIRKLLTRLHKKSAKNRYL